MEYVGTTATVKNLPWLDGAVLGGCLHSALQWMSGGKTLSPLVREIFQGGDRVDVLSALANVCTIGTALVAIFLFIKSKINRK